MPPPGGQSRPWHIHEGADDARRRGACWTLEHGCCQTDNHTSILHANVQRSRAAVGFRQSAPAFDQLASQQPHRHKATRDAYECRAGSHGHTEASSTLRPT